MRTRLLLVRHGESHHKSDGVVGGPQGCRGLTPTGRQQACQLRDRFQYDRSLEGTQALYSSTVPRAMEMAQILAEAFPEASLTQESGLNSFSVPSEVDGMSAQEYLKRYAQSGGGVFRPFETVTESWAELVARVGRSLTEIVQCHAGQTSIVVAHAQTVEASFAVFGLQSLLRPFDLQVSLASVTEWTTEEDTRAWPPARWTLVRFNDTAHLI